MDERFGKAYKLCSKKIIASIFTEGQTIKSFPIRLIYLLTPLPTEKSFQVVFSVPKKKFKKAPDRNRVKRLLREVVRKNKIELEDYLTAESKQLALFLIYLGEEIMTYNEMERKIVSLFSRLLTELKNNDLIQVDESIKE